MDDAPGKLITETNLVVDDREDPRRIAEIMARFPSAVVRRLAVGDFLVSDFVLELKLWPDFVSSIYSGHMAQQVSELELNAPGRAILAVVGNPLEARYTRREWREDPAKWEAAMASVRGQTWSILEKTSIRVMHFKSVQEFCDFLEAKMKRMAKGERTTVRSSITLKGSDRTIEEEGTDVLAAVTGLNTVAAKALMAHFGSVEAVVAASAKELAEAPQMGKVRSAHLYSVLHSKHTKPITI